MHEKHIQEKHPNIIISFANKFMRKSGRFSLRFKTGTSTWKIQGDEQEIISMKM